MNGYIPISGRTMLTPMVLTEPVQDQAPVGPTQEVVEMRIPATGTREVGGFLGHKDKTGIHHPDTPAFKEGPDLDLHPSNPNMGFGRIHIISPHTNRAPLF